MQFVDLYKKNKWQLRNTCVQLGKNKDVAFKLKSKYRSDYGFENSILCNVFSEAV